MKALCKLQSSLFSLPSYGATCSLYLVVMASEILSIESPRLKLPRGTSLKPLQGELLPSTYRQEYPKGDRGGVSNFLPLTSHQNPYLFRNHSTISPELEVGRICSIRPLEYISSSTPYSVLSPRGIPTSSGSSSGFGFALA